MELFDVLIVDPDEDSRTTLRIAARTSGIFHHVRAVGSITDALSRLDSELKSDLIFLSSTLPDARVEEFMKSASKLPSAAEVTRVLLVRAGEQDNEKLLRKLDAGIHAFLFVPFSAEDLRQVAQLAAEVKAQSKDVRLKALMQSMVSEGLRPLRAMMLLRSLGRDYTHAKHSAEERLMFSRFLAEPQRELFVELLSELCEKSKPSQAHYKGCSRRVKERGLARAIEDLAEFIPHDDE